MNADVVGALNIAGNDGTIIPSLHRGRDNGVVAHPKLLRWNGMRWEPKRAMNNRPMNTLEAKISTSEVVESVKWENILSKPLNR
jgi:hypothetical protein